MSRKTDRALPANLDAEEGLLACCLIDAGLDVANKSASLGVSANSFSRDAHVSIWQAVASLLAKSEEVDEFAVASELNRVGQLDFCGGLAEVNRIANRVETASGWKRFAEEVLAKHATRQAINQSTRAVERLYAGYDLADVLETAGTALAAISEQAGGKRDAESEKIITEADLFKFDISKPPERRLPIITLAGHPVCKKGDLMAFMAPNKSGKSSSVAAMLAATFAMPGADCLGFYAPNPDGESILHLMTEESVEDHNDMVRRSLRRAKIDTPPTWFESYHLRRFDTLKRRKFLFEKAKLLAKSGQLRLIVLDGVGDFVEDSNDLRECKWFMDEILAMTDRFNCAIASTIHTNPSLKPSERDKAIGHLGSIYERKASSTLLNKKVEKDGQEIITINTKDARKGKGSAPSFIWSEEHQMHIRHVGITENSSTPKGPGRSAVINWQGLSRYFVAGMPDVSEWVKSDMTSLAQRAGISESTVRRLAAKQIAEQSGFGE